MSVSRVRFTSTFRKVALTLWGTPRDPSVYGFLEQDLTDLNPNVNSTALVVKVMGEVMKKHKEIRYFKRFGILHLRNHCNVSVMVNIEEGESADLSFATFLNVDEMKLADISSGLKIKSGQIRLGKDAYIGPTLRMIDLLPKFIVGWALKVFSFVSHDLHISLPWFRIPRNPFGSVIVTNVGSLGIKKALVPLVPLTRATMMVSIGKIGPEAVVVAGQIVIRKIMHLGVTFDHRFFDGAQAAKMLKTFQQTFQDQIKVSAAE